MYANSTLIGVTIANPDVATRQIVLRDPEQRHTFCVLLGSGQQGLCKV